MHVDTHVVLWLQESGVEWFPELARRLLETEPLAASPMVELELQLLVEIGRVSRTPREILADLGRSLNLAVSSAPFPAVVVAAASLTWTRDPFDRLICANALADGTTLLTKDRAIREHFAQSRWA